MTKELSAHITPAANGFKVHTHDATDGQGSEMVFENFSSMVQRLRDVFSGRNRAHSFVDMAYDGACASMTPEQMRDELGELRRFKEEAVKRRGELTDRLTQTLDSLNKAEQRAQNWRDRHDSLAKYAEELEGMLKRRKIRLPKRVKQVS